MLGLKLNRQTIRQAYNKSKRFLGNAYSQTKGILGDVDSGIRNAKALYSITSPLISRLLGEDFEKGNAHVMKALSGYENIRSKVMETDDNLKHHYNAIIGDLKKNNIDIGL